MKMRVFYDDGITVGLAMILVVIIFSQVRSIQCTVDYMDG